MNFLSVALKREPPAFGQSMTILGIGVDIVHLPRIAALIARRGREPLAKRILSPDEYTEFLQRCSSDRNIEQQVMYLGSR